jgi:hypothetical protein
VPSNAIEKILAHLDESKLRFDERGRSLSLKLLRQLEKRRFTNAHALVRFHEILLFMRAYPQSAVILHKVEKILSSFYRRVSLLEEMGEDLAPLEEAEVSGIAGTNVEDTFTYNVTRWLNRRHGSQISIDWEWHDDEYRLAATWPRFLPLLEEDALVEANVPYLAWLREAKGNARQKDLAWLIERFERLPLARREQAELYESLKLPIRWELGNTRATRTLMKRRVRKIFYQTEPIRRRSEVSLEREFKSPPIPLQRLSRSQGEAILELARETSTVRYRELYGFTYGDAARIQRVDTGRGVEIFIVGLPAEHRLPLRAYHAMLIFRNGVPVCYAEGLSLFERMEIGFNVYYTFREGESAWIYALVLKIFHQLLGVSVFSIDPYQIGYQSEEGIESGAFWFYRKLGFRPTVPRLTRLMKTEERKLKMRRSYRTPAETLMQLSEGHMVYEVEPHAERGAWDRFHIRKLGLAVQRRMAKRFDGDAVKIRRVAVEKAERALNVRVRDWKELERRAFADLALVLDLIPDLARWNKDEKRDVVNIARARAGTDEARYLRLLQRHARLRDHVIKIGSATTHA